MAEHGRLAVLQSVTDETCKLVATEFDTRFTARLNSAEQAPVLICTSLLTAESRDFVSQSNGSFLANGFLTFVQNLAVPT